MSTHGAVSALLLSFLTAMTGCIASADTEEALEIDPLAVPYETMEGPETTNGLNPVFFWDLGNQQALRSLGAAALVGARGTLPATTLLSTAGGRSVLGYAMRCALPAGDAVQSSNGVVFQGDIGLAPAWTSRALTTSEQRWVTACLLQHLNGIGASVPMLLEGSHEALTPGPGDDLSSYTIGDATTFGNVFVQSLLGNNAWVCVDPGLELTCGVGISLSTLERLCGLSPTCGVSLLGLCLLHCSYSASGDPSCAPPLGPTYSQAIASKLQEAQLLALYPLCVLP